MPNSSNNPFRDPNRGPERGLSLTFASSLEYEHVSQMPLASNNPFLRRSSTAVVQAEPPSVAPTPDSAVDRHHYINTALANVSRSFNYATATVADRSMRLTWKMFLNIVPKKDDQMSLALLEGRTSDALALIQSGRQIKQRRWSTGGSTISRKDICLAALFGDFEVVDKLLAAGWSPHFQWMDGLTALHCAAMGGFLEVVRRLLTAGSTGDSLSSDFGSPLFLAVLGEKIDVIDVIVSNNAAFLAESGKSGSVVHAACMTDNVALVQTITQRESILSVRRYVYPAQLRKLHHFMTTKTMLDPVEEALLAMHTNMRLERIEAPPLAFAAYMGCENIVRHLLEQAEINVDVHCKAETALVHNLRAGSTTHTALTLASARGHDKIVQMLLDANASSRSVNYEHSDAMFLAILNGFESTALLLLQYGAVVRQTSLDLAAKKAMPHFVEQATLRRGSEPMVPSANWSQAPIRAQSVSQSVQSQLPNQRDSFNLMLLGSS